MLPGRVGRDLPDQLARSLLTVTMTLLLPPLQSDGPAPSQQTYVDRSRDQSFIKTIFFSNYAVMILL